MKKIGMNAKAPAYIEANIEFGGKNHEKHL